MKKFKKIIGIAIVALTLCLSITAISAEENLTGLETTDNVDTISANDNVELAQTDSAINDNEELSKTESEITNDEALSETEPTQYIAKNFRDVTDMKVDDDASCTFTESDLITAKNYYMGVTKTVKNANVIQVKEIKKVSKKIKTYKKVKVTKKFTVGKLVNGRLKMDHKKFNKLTKKYKKLGYKVTDKWSGKKRVLIAKKTVKKFKGYKTKQEWKKTGNWITLADAKYQLTYSSGGMSPEGYYVYIAPTQRPYTGMEYYSGGDLFKIL